jgi:hypothetical protein
MRLKGFLIGVLMVAAGMADGQIMSSYPTATVDSSAYFVGLDSLPSGKFKNKKFSVISLATFLPSGGGGGGASIDSVRGGYGVVIQYSPTHITVGADTTVIATKSWQPNFANTDLTQTANRHYSAHKKALAIDSTGGFYVADTTGDTLLNLNGNRAANAGLGITPTTARMQVSGGTSYEQLTGNTYALNVAGRFNVVQSAAPAGPLNYIVKFNGINKIYLDSTTHHCDIGATGDTTKISAAYNLPWKDGTNGQVLTTDGAGHTTWTTGAAGSVASVSSGNLSPLFTTSVSNPTSTPAISYSLSNAGAYTVLCNTTNASAAPGYSKIDIGNMVYGTLAAGQFPALTGDITTSGGSLATTLKNTGTAGTYGDGTHSLTMTTDAQGRVTSVSSNNLSSTYATLASPTFTGTVTVPTQTAGDNSTKAASTAYVDVTYSTQVTSASSYTTSVTPTSSVAAITSNVRYVITAQAGNLLFNNPTGSWADGQILIVRIKDNGTARSLSYGTKYRAGSDVALPSTTTLGKNLYEEFMYNSTDDKFDIVGKADGY